METNLAPGTLDTGIQQDTGTPGMEETSVQNDPKLVSEPEKTFTKQQVNDLMRKRIDKSHKAFFTRYGVNDLEGLDALFSKSSSYDELEAKNKESEQKYSDLETQHKDLVKRYAYKVGNIDEKKIADIETYFKGKGIDINEESLMKELVTHPDWVNKVSTIQKLGAEAAVQTEKDEKAEAERIFGVKLS